ncbi:hypothetical protein BV25DRAFT_600514 [Artomyces pyxidatus]|uniref:Uncharacterized protein n=1 Tax=Artomyces pyxidatus TaxID=48021 RepID=A0ACB8T3A9_9AGAM|nr:hypothetical protein BV25DRAFT_600514 [Artomyces pyxidatus]
MSLPPFEPHTFKHTAPPNPNWTYCQRSDATEEGKAWAEAEKSGWKTIDVNAPEEKAGLYPLMISGIVPRPIAFVSSVSETGIENLSPFSWFNQVCANPPMIAFSAANPPTGPKDTPTNIKATKGFTVNIISEVFSEAANAVSIDAPSNVSEWDFSGLTKEPSIHVKAPRVKESAFSMECELYEAIELKNPATGQVSNTLIIGLVKFIHVRKDVLTPKGTVDLAKLKPLARMGDITYARVGDGFRLDRPLWSELGDQVQEALATQKNAAL